MFKKIQKPSVNSRSKYKQMAAPKTKIRHTVLKDYNKTKIRSLKSLISSHTRPCVCNTVSDWQRALIRLISIKQN